MMKILVERFEAIEVSVSYEFFLMKMHSVEFYRI